jgi:predicted outer membrane protein
MSRFTAAPFAVAMFVAVAGVLSSSTHADTGVPILRQAPPPAVDPARGDTRDFISRMTIAGLAQVQLANLGIERASNPDVKAFAQMMLKDHSQSNAELRALVTHANVQPPTELDKKHRDLVEHLSNVLPAEFDRRYAQVSIDIHQDMASQLGLRAGGQVPATAAAGSDRPRAATASATAGIEATAGTGGVADADPLSRWAGRTLATVERHLERARQFQQNIK